MKKFFGYTRVSTVKQGEKGVSLQEQHDAIERYAKLHDLEVIQWFEEKQTAAKRGRPIFNQMLKLLRRRKADGVIIHKIDRSARNLRDWADLGELIDQDIDVRFANESLDLHSRGGRLSADIQAVVAADYIRNLREEIRKGFYGRLKQGLYPLPAPVGYRDIGKGKRKEWDPAQAPLVRMAFELYATGRYNLDTLVDEMYRRGLRSRRGDMVSRNGLSRLLNNPFYIGIIRLTQTNETFAGTHKPLISTSLFKRVQQILTGKTNTRVQHHNFLFRRMLTCKPCGSTLTGELQKGHTYYRCHTKGCSPHCIREEVLDEQISNALSPLDFSAEEKSYLKTKVASVSQTWAVERDIQLKALELNLNSLRDRLQRLTDAYIDRLIERDIFEERNRSIVFDRRSLEEQVAKLQQDTPSLSHRLEEFFELAGSAYITYKMTYGEEKRELIHILSSNRLVDGKKLELKLKMPFQEVANRLQTTNGAPYRDILRTWDELFPRLLRLIDT